MNNKTFKTILRISAGVFLLVCCFSPLYNIMAEGEYTLLEALPVPGASTITEVSNLGQYLNGVFKLGIGLASVLAVLMITIGGLQYMTSDKVQLKADSKTTISNALWGLVLILSSWLLLNTINTDLVTSGLNLTPVETPSPAPAPEPEPESTKTCYCYTRDPNLRCFKNKNAVPKTEKDNYESTQVPLSKHCE